MELGFAAPCVLDVAACGARLMASDSGTSQDLEPDMDAALAALDDARLSQPCVGDQLQKRDEHAIALLRGRTSINKRGRFGVGSVPPSCYPILKTHKHLFRMRND